MYADTLRHKAIQFAREGIRQPLINSSRIAGRLTTQTTLDLLTARLLHRILRSRSEPRSSLVFLYPSQPSGATYHVPCPNCLIQICIPIDRTDPHSTRPTKMSRCPLSQSQLFISALPNHIQIAIKKTQMSQVSMSPSKRPLLFCKRNTTYPVPNVALSQPTSRHYLEKRQTKQDCPECPRHPVNMHQW